MPSFIFCRLQILQHHTSILSVHYSNGLRSKLTKFKPIGSGNSRLSSQTRFVRFVSTVKGSTSGTSEWRSILTKFLPVGLCLFAVMQWRNYRKYSMPRTAKQWEIDCYCMLPLRTVSRSWGWLADKELPQFLRPFVYGLYANTFGVNLAEALHEDFKAYKSLADFFVRPLKEGLRKIDAATDLVSPCDGTLLHYGTVPTGEVEQVKGVTYSLEQFLGQNIWSRNSNNIDTNSNYRNSLLMKPNDNHTLFQCVLYLAPGDYHRFHSPTEWQATHRRHFHGELLSVSPRIAKWLPGLFCLNERVVYLGNWLYGFFSYTAVGATNVGTVKVYFDKALRTNHPKATRHCKEQCLGTNVILKKGDIMGEFRMGSTIVLVFEAPVNFRFSVPAGAHIKMGQSIGSVINNNNNNDKDIKSEDSSTQKKTSINIS